MALMKLPTVRRESFFFSCSSFWRGAISEVEWVGRMGTVEKIRKANEWEIIQGCKGVGRIGDHTEAGGK